MRTLYLIIFVTFFGVAYGQINDNIKIFKSSDYPKDKYLIKQEKATFLKYNIEITHVKLINGINNDSDFFCRAWLKIYQGNKILKTIYYKNIEPVGSCGGFFIPKIQPRKDYFIFSKCGDYEEYVFIFDSTGNITKLSGSAFQISKDKRYLFCNDGLENTFTIFDLNEGKTLCSLKTEIDLADWYFQDNKYFASTWDSQNAKVIKDKIVIFDFSTRKIKAINVDSKYIKQDCLLTLYADQQDIQDCSCGK